MAKINLDKYYTDPTIVDFCLTELAKLNLPITEYLEPSAGAGAFSLKLPEGSLAFDIEPEHESIVKQDFLSLELPYKEGRCVVGNPPFGERNALVKKFYAKSLMLGDYIAFILPITQLDNEQSLYQFKLIKSINLGETIYSDRTVHCCFNIYVRDVSKLLNSRVDYSLKDITVLELKRTKEFDIPKFDFAVCTWGNRCCGKIPSFKGQYAQEHYIVVNNESFRDRVIEVCKATDWKESVAPKNTSSKKIQTWRIYKYLKEQIPELE
jgi:hypothetical protein